MSGISLRTRCALVALLALLPFSLLLAMPADMLGALFGEDRLVEWLGALAWLVAAGFFAVTLRRRPLLADAVRPAHFWLAGLALMTFLAAGEEISWGQRLLGYETPDVVSRVNLQQEMNLHNLAPLDVRVSPDGTEKTGVARWLTFGRIGSLIWLGYLVALPIAYRYVPALRRLANCLRVPVPPIEVALAGAVSYAAFSSVVLFEQSSVAGPKLLRVSANELKETVVAVLFLTAAMHFWTRRRTTPSSAK